MLIETKMSFIVETTRAEFRDNKVCGVVVTKKVSMR